MTAPQSYFMLRIQLGALLLNNSACDWARETLSLSVSLSPVEGFHFDLLLQ